MHSKTRKRMIIMLIIVVLVLALLVGFNLFKGHMIKQYMANMGTPTETVTATKAEMQSWQPKLNAVGGLRAAKGADLALDVSGLVTEVAIQSGQEVKKGDLILKLRDNDTRASLNQAQAALSLAQVSYGRAQKQIKVNAIAQASFDTVAADLKVKQATVAQQQALVDKNALRAPFDGRVGIIAISPGAYINAGTQVVTLQQIDPILVDFNLPQKDLARLDSGQTVHVSIDGLPDKTFDGSLTAISPKVDSSTRNVMVEARIPNADGRLKPGMFAHVTVDAGEMEEHITLPQTAITYNPYGSTVFVIEDKQIEDKDGKSQTQTVVQQSFVTTGGTRGDQVAIVKGLVEGVQVVTSGQMKLKNGTPVKVDNSIVPTNNPNPTPTEQ